MFEVKLASIDQLEKNLSKKELETFPKWLSNLTYEEISKSLDVGPETTKTHVSHIIQKTGFKDKTEALGLSIARGWVTVKETGVGGVLFVCLTLLSQFSDDSDFRTSRISRPQVTRARDSI